MLLLVLFWLNLHEPLFIKVDLSWVHLLLVGVSLVLLWAWILIILVLLLFLLLSKVLHQLISSVLPRLHHIVTIGEMSDSSISIRITFFKVIFTIHRELLVVSTLIVVNTFFVRFRPTDNFLLLLLLRNTRLVVWDKLIDRCRFLDVIGGLVWLTLIMVIVGRLNVAVLFLLLDILLLELLLRKSFEYGTIWDLLLLMAFDRVVVFRWLGTRFRSHTFGSVNLSHHLVPFLGEFPTVFLLLRLLLLIVFRHFDINLLDLLYFFRNLVINEEVLLLGGRIIIALGSIFSHCLRDDCLLMRRLLGGETGVDCDLLDDWLHVAAKFIDLTLLGVIDNLSRRNGISLNSLVNFLKTWCRHNHIFLWYDGTFWLARLTDCSNIRLPWLLIIFLLGLRG